MQETLVAAVDQRIHKTKPDPVAREWLRSTAANMFRTQLRRSRRRPEQELLPEVEADAAWRAFAGDEGDGDASDYVIALRACVSKLDRRHRFALELRYGEGTARETMAAELEISEQGVKTMLRRLREVLRECIEGKIQDKGQP
jgi:RNA polymerase sigma factor (sigma-70 family)